MTATLDRRPVPGEPGSRPRTPWVPQLLRRLHWLAGIVVGPFILVAALSGAAYAVAPSIERVLYDEALTAPAAGTPLPLVEQVTIAQDVVGDEAQLSAIRPAPEDGATTRVLFAADGLQESESRAIFVDPVSGEVRGDMTVYGTSGALPLRTAIDHFHRGLGLGDVGRLYSELAASWLGIVVLAGLALWVVRWRQARRRAELVRPEVRAKGLRRLLSWHASIGIWVAIGALFLSATGITWSQHAGTNVTDLRAALGWTTPSLTTGLGAAPGTADPHADHGGHGAGAAAGGVDVTVIDDVLAVAQGVNVNVGAIEIRPPSAAGQAWVVQEIQRWYPTEVDGVAIDGATLEVVSRVDFADYGLVAKLARWGIDIHMGQMFGLANQVVMATSALGIAALVVLGYRMWWTRGPYRRRPGVAPEEGALARAPWWGLLVVGGIGVGVGVLLPLVGWTLVAFVIVDGVLVAARTRAAP